MLTFLDMQRLKNFLKNKTALRVQKEHRMLLCLNQFQSTFKQSQKTNIAKPLSAIKEGTLKCHMNASCQVLSMMPKIPVISVGSKMERSILVHSNWSDLLGRNLPFHFDKPVHYPTSLQQISLTQGQFRNRITKSHSSQLAHFDQKTS